ncbi:MAG: hypothetical protein WB524_11840 [Acidobacteriaceae bacterium]
MIEAGSNTQRFEIAGKARFIQTMKRGGRRPGAGRKPSTLKGVLKRLPAKSAELVLAEIDANSKWLRLADSEDERIVLETLKYLTDRAYGKAKQVMDMDHAGGLTLRVEHIGASGAPKPPPEECK